MTYPAFTLQRLSQYDRIIHTPGEAASLVAGGCGCEDEPRQGFSAFAIADPEAPASAVTWSGTICIENEPTGDGRMMEANALRWDVPIPLRYADVDTGGHDGAEVVGRILTITREQDGRISATGDIDMRSEMGRKAARQLGEELTNGVSVDLDSVSFEIRIAQELLGEINDDLAEDPPQVEPVEPGTDDEGRVTVVEMKANDEMMVTTDARIRAATIVAIPAFAGAQIYLDNPLSDAPAEDDEDFSVATALAAGAAPMEPPAAWFSNPVLSGPTPITITPDGRIYGHLAVWGTCHTAYSGQCVEPPRNSTGYAYFHTGAVLTAEGTEVATGRITMDTLHAGRALNSVDTLAHYEHTGKQAADVRAGDDEFGIWISGAARPGLTADHVRSLRSSPLSGDWRRIGANLELVAALAVNSPGFPVPRPQGLVASGVMQSLVAAGSITPEPEAAPLGFDMNSLATRVADLLVRREQTKASAAQLATRVRRATAQRLAQRAGV